jgi:hypothetical protein
MSVVGSAGLPDEILVCTDGQRRVCEVGLPVTNMSSTLLGPLLPPYVAMPVQVICAARGDCSPRLIAMAWALLEGRIIASLRAMFAILQALGMFVADLFKSRSRLEAENLFLRHQLTIAMRRAPPRLRLRGSDRALLIGMTRLWPNLRGMTQVVQPETILRWHRAGFKVFWRWKSRNRAGRPKIDRGLCDLIRQTSRENPLWGVSRIHGELLMLGL